MIIQKIVNSIKDKSFKKKLYIKFHRVHGMKSKFAASIERQERVYQSLQKKYQYVVDQHVPSKECDRKPSDYVWICWFQGIENAPKLVKACVQSIKENIPEKNIGNYVTFPKYISEKYKKGSITPAHYSDLLRIQLLSTHGGMWIDSTVLCTSSNIPTCITNAPMFVYKELSLLFSKPVVASSWLMEAYSSHPIITLTRDLLFEYWKTHNYLQDYFLFHIFFSIATKKYQEEWKKIPVFNNNSPHVLQFELKENYSEERWNQIKEMSVFHKLTRHIMYEDFPNSFYMHILDSYLEKTEKI